MFNVLQNEHWDWFSLVMVQGSLQQAVCTKNFFFSSAEPLYQPNFKGYGNPEKCFYETLMLVLYLRIYEIRQNKGTLYFKQLIGCKILL